MSSLRLVNRGVPEVDVEAPADYNGKDSSDPPKTAATAFAAASASGALSPPSKGSSHNPVFIAKVIFRKVYELLLSSDEGDLSQADGIITLLRDVILGFIFGSLAISFLVFLDHRNIIHFQSAHNFRAAAFQLLNDPETIANIEESSDMKFIILGEYETQKKEIDLVAERLEKQAEVLELRTVEADDKQKEVDAIKSEYDNLMHNPILELDKFCGGCTWGMKITCDARMQFLEHKYSIRPIQAKISTMETPSCKKEA